MADIHATLEQQILDLAQRRRITDVHHHGEADYLGRTVEIAERIFHPPRLRADPTRFKPIWSDTAVHSINCERFAVQAGDINENRAFGR